MNHEHEGQAPAANDRRGENGAIAGRIVDQSEELLNGHREVWIEHGTELYRLWLTASGKLYLTK